MKRFYVLLLLQFIGVFAFANLYDFGGFSVGGKITDSNGNPLAGATVVVENTLLGVSSGKNGSFLISRLKSGNYTLVVSYMGYDTKKVDVSVSDNVYVDISLNESSLMCEEVVVIATRASTRMPIAQSTMDKEMVRASNSGFDVPYLLEMLPSVVATSEGGTGIGNTTLRIRGTDHT
ncbi:MAG TPA: carboxypeptidase-like regulatory domain-containing protein, partial [Tenuifilaceae bacterium]|nr:carboxypeptidase-like regulatory domain-containing protein [Tenuifilaceae bacterium]